MFETPDFIERLRRVVERRGERIAVDADDATLTYLELDRLSDRLAHRFRAMGVRPGRCVGISLPRGARELVAFLATLKAGGAYVALTPSHPTERLRSIITDADPPLLVLHPGSPLSEGCERQVCFVDALSALDEEPLQDEAPLPSCDPEQLAYLMFTSGSTGRPKGVEIQRAALANFLQSMAHTPGLSEDERLLAITTTAFDISCLELFLPLWVGATTVIADLETTRDPRLLRRRLEQGGITTLQATPATWRLLLEAGWIGDGAIRILCGGEAMSPALADRLLIAGGEVWNMYGPTETTIWSSVQRITRGYDRVTIGRPIDETRMYVLDEGRRVLPVGNEGEIGIAGRGVAVGYRGRPDLTAERFVDVEGERVYRTGDLGRQLDDGRFEWLGRLDHQVKIRGFRIELGEIESVLRAVPGVGEALIVADRPEDGDPRLVAYWVGNATRDDLIGAARRALPAYMVPAVYVRLDRFPMNTNGKIARKRLPRPGATVVDDEQLQRRPQTDMEMRVADAWREVLGLARVPADQDFFTLGGSSVLAIEVVARLERQLKVEIPLQAFFAAPTVEGFARRIGDGASRDEPIVVPLRRGAPDRAPLFCLLGIALYQDLALALHGDRPVIGMHVPFRYVPGREPRPTLVQIARRYVELIRAQQEHGPYHVLGLCFGGVVAYEVARQLEALGEDVESVVVIDAVLPTAVRIDPGRRLLAYVGSMQRAWRKPRELERWLRQRGGELGARLLSRRRAPGNGHAVAANAIELPIDGPEVDAEVRRFAGLPSQLASRLVIVRATQERVPQWMAVAPDHGWGGRATEVVVHDIPADHLGVLREPHVRSLARFVGDPAV